MKEDVLKIRELSSEIGCGLSLTRDLLTLAGGDEKLVLEASFACLQGVGAVKAYIVNARFEKLEAAHHEI